VIEFLFWEGCPSHERALADLIDLMDSLDIERDELRITEVHTEADAQRQEFVGSPTIRVDKVDVQDPGAEPIGLACRVYFHRNGKPSPLPDREDVKHLLTEYAEQTQEG
jgi:hypothetical protein